VKSARPSSDGRDLLVLWQERCLADGVLPSDFALGIAAPFVE
jgi:hypothetical protein